jgi:hypothetical protein
MSPERAKELLLRMLPTLTKDHRDLIEAELAKELKALKQ